MGNLARMFKRPLVRVLSAIAQRVTNARFNGLNTETQWLERSARDCRNRERYRNVIYVHLGGLRLYPASAIHSRS